MSGLNNLASLLLSEHGALGQDFWLSDIPKPSFSKGSRGNTRAVYRQPKGADTASAQHVYECMQNAKCCCSELGALAVQTHMFRRTRL